MEKSVAYNNVQNSILQNPDLLHCKATQEAFAFYDKIMLAYENGFRTKQVAISVKCSQGLAGSAKRLLAKAKAGTLSENDNRYNQTMFAWAVLRASELQDKQNESKPINHPQRLVTLEMFLQSYNSESDLIQVCLEDDNVEWDAAEEIHANSKLLRPFMRYVIKEIEPVQSRQFKGLAIRIGISHPDFCVAEDV